MPDRLTLRPCVRASEKLSGGTHKSERHFLDFVINERSLWEMVGRSLDTVSVFCAEYVGEETTKAVNRLLLTEPAGIPNGRRSIFVCSECGDLGCGAITCVVSEEGDSIVWQKFGYENNYEPEAHFADYESVGPFSFDAAAYDRTLREGLELLRGMRG